MPWFHALLNAIQRHLIRDSRIFQCLDTQAQLLCIALYASRQLQLKEVQSTDFGTQVLGHSTQKL